MAAGKRSRPQVKKQGVIKKAARIAVLGGGWWSQKAHLPHLRANRHAEIVAIVEPSQAPRASKDKLDSSTALGQRYGVPIFKSVDDLLKSGVELDGVIVCTSHSSHFACGAKVLAKGLHVLMEKPMTTDVAEGRKLVALAAKLKNTHGAKFMINNTANWRPQAVAAAEVVASGGIGKVEHIVCSMHSPLLFLFEDPRAVGWTKPSGSMLGNGFGYGQISHLLAWVFKVSGLCPSEVYCAMTHSKKSGADLTDAAVIVCEGGATISLSGAASLPGLPGPGGAHTSKRISVRLFGSLGMLTYEGQDQVKGSGNLELLLHDGTKKRLAKGFLFENYSFAGDGPESLQAFIATCRGLDAYIGADAELGLAVVRALDAMYRSAKSGRSEKVKR